MREALAVLALLAFAAVGAAAQVLPAPRPAELPAYITAEEVTYDNELGVVVARGAVEVTQGERTLLADTVTYNQRAGSVVASGNVSMVEPGGEVLFADYMELTDAMKEGVIRDIRILLTDNSRLAANGARRSGGNRTEMQKGVFSPCKPCEEDPARAPLWQLKADRVVHDQEAKVIRYNDARMEMWGVPVAYTPYFQHPDPTVKRQSGILAPVHVYNSDIGLLTGVPYYHVIDKQSDVTLYPLYATKKGPVGRMEYRHAFSDGGLEFDGSVTRTDRGFRPLFDQTDRPTEEENQIRGHLLGRGRWDITESWRAGFDVQRASDKTYMDLYRMNNFRLWQDPQLLTSNAFVEGFRGRSYAAANAYAFQGLRSFDTGRTTPYIAPLVDLNYLSEPTSYGARWSLDANSMVLERNDGADSRRLSLLGGWQMPWISPLGDMYKVSATLQGDLYHVDSVRDPGRPSVVHAGATGRLFPQLGAEWRYPFVRQGEEYRQLIEPVVAAYFAPNGHNPSHIPNEDSTDIDLDYSNLFSANRFTGVDRVDGGVRAVYGLRTGVYHTGGGFGTVFFGQSYNVTRNENFTDTSGLEGNRSDYVAKVELSPMPYINLLTRLRFDAEDFSVHRHETAAVLGPPLFQVVANYLRADSSVARTGRTEQIGGTVSSRVNDNWTVRFRALRDLGSDDGLGWVNYGAGVLYEDECFTFTANWIRSFAKTQESTADDTIYFQLNFKLLGTLAGGFDAPRFGGGGSSAN